MAPVDLNEALKLQGEYIAQGVLPEVSWLMAKARLGDPEALAELKDLVAYCMQFEE